MTECARHPFWSACGCPASVRRAPAEEFIDPTDAIRQHACKIRMDLLRRLLDREEWARLVELSIERSGPDSIGAKEYGNASYDKTDAELWDEGAAEIADLIFYSHIPHTRATPCS